MNYFEYNRKPTPPSDLIEWEALEVNFEFHSGVCVERSTIDAAKPQECVPCR